MIFLGDLNKDGKVGLTHYMPLDPNMGLGKSYSDLMSEGLVVDELPLAEAKDDEYAVLYVDKEKKEAYYKYFKKETVVDEKSILVDRIAKLESAMSDLILASEGGLK